MPTEEILNADNTVQEDVVDSQPTGDIDGQDEGLDLNDADSGADNTDEKKSPTRKYSERLNKDREAIRKQLEQEYAPVKNRVSELELELRAAKEGKSVEDIRAEQAEQEKANRDIVANDPNYQALMQFAIQQQEKGIVESLQKEFPDDNITGLTDEFREILMAGNGRISPSEAYSVLKNRAIQKQPPKKELPGSVKTEGEAINKEFYTREEVEAMSTEEVMKNYDAVIASQKKWR